jgi:hypothetical protein
VKSGTESRRADASGHSQTSGHCSTAGLRTEKLQTQPFFHFSSERLLHYITLLNRDVEIFIRPLDQLER